MFATFCEGNKGSLWTKISQETHTSRFGKTVESECKERLAMHACSIGLSTLLLENLSSCFTKLIHRQKQNKSIILEAIVNYMLWIWHACFGLPKNNNDLNILGRSLLIQDFLGVVGVNLNFEVNGNKHFCYYLLVNGIYL